MMPLLREPEYVLKYTLTLDSVDRLSAHFSWVDRQEAKFVMPRRDWEKAGRPVQIDIAVQAATT